jgi:predicted ATPase
MIDRVTGNKALPESIRQDIIERTDGIPLFVEEMTKAVLEAGGEEDTERAIAAIPSAAAAVPSSLNASLLARLDRLGSAKEVAQIGAVMGREFSHALLAAVAQQPEAELQSALDRLIKAGLLFSKGAAPYLTLLFKHALVRDAAYGTLLREPRRVLHARIAEIMESQFAEISENQPELLAHHYTEAGLIEKAATKWGKAGRRSHERSAMMEAVAQLTRALQLIATLPASPAVRQEQIKLQVALIAPILYVKGYAAPEAKAAVQRARLLIEQAEAVGEPPEDPMLLFSVLFGFWIANYIISKRKVACELAAQFVALAEKHGASFPLMQGELMLGLSLVTSGDFARARPHLDRALAIYDPSAHRPLAIRFGGADGGVVTLSSRSWTLWMLGYPDAALADREQAMKDAREIGHASSLMLALMWSSWIELVCGNSALASAQCDQLIQLAEHKRAAYYKANGLTQQGCVLALTGKSANAIQIITCGLTAHRSIGTTIIHPFSLSSLALAYAQLGQIDDAWQCIDEAMTTMETTDEKWMQAEVNRIAGEVALMLPDAETGKAQIYFEHALSVARAQQTKSWELRAAMSLARLWRDQGKAQQARELLAPVYDWFTEGFKTRDLKEAKALLDELQ